MRHSLSPAFGSPARGHHSPPGGTRSAAVLAARPIVLLQAESSAEVRAALLAATVQGLKTQRVALRELQTNLSARAALAALPGQLLPVGTVEFVRAAMSARRVDEPPAMGYEGVRDFLHREVVRTTLGEARKRKKPFFIKPVATKLFDGFVYDTDHLTGHSWQQIDHMATLDASTPVWVSDVVEFVCEWRYYVDASGKILARARYDADGDDDAPLPVAEVVQSAIDATVTRLLAQGTPHPFAIDMGVLTNGRTAVCELNDAWSIGLYAHACTPSGAAWKPDEYLEFLLARWRSIVANSGVRLPGSRRQVYEDDDDEEEPTAAAAKPARRGRPPKVREPENKSADSI